MRSLPAGLAVVRARLSAASKEAAAGVVSGAVGGEELQLYERALRRMKNDGLVTGAG